jgi:hydroxypyruvate isomerase
MELHLPVIVHMQIADVPARNEPGTGEIGWPFVFRRMDELGYTGWVGLRISPRRENRGGADMAAEVRGLRARAYTKRVETGAQQ